MTNDEYQALKEKGSDFRKRLRARLNAPKIPSVSNEDYDKIRSLYNSVDKQITKFFKDLESKKFYKMMVYNKT